MAASREDLFSIVSGKAESRDIKDSSCMKEKMVNSYSSMIL